MTIEINCHKSSQVRLVGAQSSKFGGSACVLASEESCIQHQGPTVLELEQAA